MSTVLKNSLIALYRAAPSGARLARPSLDTSKTDMFTSLQKIRILLDRKKRPGPRKNLTMVLATKNVKKKSCGENLWGDIWTGAVSRCGCGVRVRFTCGQDFARTAGSGADGKYRYFTTFDQQISAKKLVFRFL